MKGGPTPRWPGAGPALRAQSDRAAAGLSRAARNLAKHKVAGVREAIETAGARLEYLPPYSPDLNPIENLWSKVKPGWKSRAPRTARQLCKATGAAFATVTSEDCHGFFLHAGYAT